MVEATGSLTVTAGRTKVESELPSIAWSRDLE